MTLQSTSKKIKRQGYKLLVPNIWGFERQLLSFKRIMRLIDSVSTVTIEFCYKIKHFQQLSRHKKVHAMLFTIMGFPELMRKYELLYLLF